MGLSLKNIKPSVYNDDRITPFMCLCRLSLDTSEGSNYVFMYYRVLSAFHSRGTDFNEQSTTGDTALFYAIRSGNIEAVDFLCRHGADVEIRNKANETPVMVAVQGRKHEIFRCLLESGGEIDFSKTPYEDLIRLAGSQAIKFMLTEIFTLYQVMQEKSKELINTQRNIERDQMLLGELGKTLRKVDKKTTAPLTT